MANANSAEIYQLKISLKHFKPPIWRRVQMPKDSTFEELHHAIISVMSWGNTHLHYFKKPCPRGCDERDELEVGLVSKDKETGMERPFSVQWGIKKYNEKTFKLCDYFKAPKDVIVYDYDQWYHIIVLEKILPLVVGKEYPICLAGRRGHPPEHGPTGEEGSDYDSDEWENEVFDPKSVTFKRFPEDMAL